MAKELNFTDTILQLLLGRKTGISVLQIGGNDGVNSDFIRWRALKYGWSGVIVEPHPVYFDALTTNYSHAPRFVFENIAISTERSRQPLFFVRTPPPDKPWAIGIASFDVLHLTKQGFTTEEIDSVLVECEPLQAVVQRNQLFSPDVLVIDVEGHELQVLQSADFSVFNPKLIIVETAHLKEAGFRKILNGLPDHYRGFYAGRDSIIFNADFYL